MDVRRERPAALIVVDASAVMAVLDSEADSHAFHERLETPGPKLMAAPTRFELTLAAFGRKGDAGPSVARRMVERFALEIVTWTPDHAEAAEQAFLRFGKGRHPAGLNFGDCMAYALAKSLDVPLLYKGDDFSKTDIRSAL